MKRSILFSLGIPVLGAASLVAGIGLTAAGQPRAEAQQPLVLPVVSPAAVGQSARGAYIGAVGVAEPSSELIEVAPNRSGVVAEVLVETGHEVRLDEPLARLDGRAAEAALAERRAQLARAQAQLRELDAAIPATRARLNQALATLRSREAEEAEARAQVVRAEADLDERRRQLDAGEAIADRDAISREERDRRRSAAAQAAATLAGAEAALVRSEANTEAARAMVAEMQAQLDLLLPAEATNQRVAGARRVVAEMEVGVAEAALEAAQVELDLLTVNAPVAGRVLRVNARRGEFAAVGGDSGEALFVMGASDPMHLRVEIDEADIARFRPEAPARASARGNSGQFVELSFVRIEPLVVPRRVLSGRSDDRVDTRVLEVIYQFPAERAEGAAFGSVAKAGQQFDVFIDAAPAL